MPPPAIGPRNTTHFSCWALSASLRLLKVPSVSPPHGEAHQRYFSKERQFFPSEKCWRDAFSPTPSVYENHPRQCMMQSKCSINVISASLAIDRGRRSILITVSQHRCLTGRCFQAGLSCRASASPGGVPRRVYSAGPRVPVSVCLFLFACVLIKENEAQRCEMTYSVM